jgi:DNA-binding response OmpR family regulator
MSILVVMADGVDAGVMSFLVSRADTHVVLANTLAEARRYLGTHAWSVIVVEEELPDGSAVDLLADLRTMTADSGILVLGASSDVLEKVLILEQGADDYLVQPYEPAELVARVRTLARRFQHRASSGHDATIRVGDLALDVSARVVVLPDKRSEHLTPNEARLLHYLMLHAPRTVERWELNVQIFGSDQSRDSSNAIDVYVRRIRCKIESNPDSPRYLVTVRGSGYRLNTTVANLLKHIVQ